MTTTKSDLIHAVAEANGFAQNKSVEIIEILLELIKTKLAAGEDVLVSGFGKFCIKKNYLGQRKNFHGMHFWAQGYFVSTVGADEGSIREYIRKQEREDARLDQLHLFDDE